MAKLSDKIRTEALGNVDQEVENAGIKTMVFEQMFNKMFYMRENLEEERVGLHASSIIVSDNDFCIREQILSLLYKPNDKITHPVGLMRIFAAGNSIHEKWQGFFVKAKVAFAIEDRSFSEQYDLYFTPDAIIYVAGVKYVVEIKSANCFAYKGFIKANTHASALKQIQLYMHMKGIRQGLILVEDKNFQDFKIFVVEYDPSKVLKYLIRLQRVQDGKVKFLNDKKDLAPRIKKCDCNSCKRALKCPMRDSCYNIGIGRVRL